MLRFGCPVLDLCRLKPFLEQQAMFDPGFPHGHPYYIWGAVDVKGGDDNAFAPATY